MGARGPAPEPTALRVIKGNPGKRPLNRREPSPDCESPECPEHVRSDPVALAEWERLVPILLGMRVLTSGDGLILANLCLVHSNLIANLRRVRELNEGGKSGIGGIVIATSTGYLAPNQFYLNVKSAMDQELKLCRELGLTPSARTRINTVTEQKKPANAWEAHRSTAGGR